ncbi:outer membrane protein assembly factor BamC [Salmonella enterica subsp. enterica serovar Typhimurium]|nr:outer membrane protein assembly factor BamC [Salmonella enterica subsp. enterica serovar Typhimurium]
MAYSVQKSRLAKVAGVSLVLLLAACSSDSRYKRQVSGDESYLDAAPLAELHAPAGMILPITTGDYVIPVTKGSGAVGKALDIRPPAQPLALVSGARTQFSGDTATDAANAAQNRSAATMDVQSAADDTGLPMLVVRGPFNLVWQRLPAALEKVGMKVTDSTRSQGSMAVTYKPLSDSDWRDLGASDPGLASGDYKLQVGDLDNRSSLQFIDPKGHTLTQSQNDALVAVFQAAFNK